MEDPFLSQLYSWFSSLGTTFEQKQQKFVASSPKTTWDKALSIELLSKSYPTKEKTLKGMLARRIQGMAYEESKTLFCRKAYYEWILKNPILLSG